ncbi:MAG: flagellar basal body-associated protein FliL [Polaromonas sp.]|nr:flagellar basal body-associated protein FliL [Polaromonas sp.]
MATSTEKGDPPKKSRTLRVVMFSLLALGLAGTAGAAYYYYYLKSKPGSAQAVIKVEAPIFLALEPFTVNLQPNGRSRFLHVAVTLKMTDSKSQSQVAQYLPEVRSRVLTVLSNRAADSLLTTEERALLADEIMGSLNQPFAANLPPQKIADVLFTTFMLQ